MRTLAVLVVLLVLATGCGDVLAPVDLAEAPAAADDASEPADDSGGAAEPADGGGDAAAPAEDPSPDDVAMGDMIVPDVSDGLPAGDPGTEERLRSARDRTTRTNDGVGVFRTVCGFAGMNFDDPIVYPGEPGRSHLHAYFGNTSIDAFSTAESIATTGASTCAGGAINRTGYWVPALLDAESRAPVEPTFAIIYYKSGYRGVAPEDVQPMPEGLRMIAGNAKAAGGGDDNPYAEWVCIADSSKGGTGTPTPHIPDDCDRGEVLRLKVEFPQCWDGDNLDSADHTSHMAYAEGRDNGCPDSHPVPLPVISVNVDYEVDDPAAVARWRLASDAYDRSLPGGMTGHSDWFNGWDPQIVETFLDHCYRPAEDCGTDNLNDGTGLDRPQG